MKKIVLIIALIIGSFGSSNSFAAICQNGHLVGWIGPSNIPCSSKPVQHSFRPHNFSNYGSQDGPQTEICHFDAATCGDGFSLCYDINNPSVQYCQRYQEPKCGAGPSECINECVKKSFSNDKGDLPQECKGAEAFCDIKCGGW